MEGEKIGLVCIPLQKANNIVSTIFKQLCVCITLLSSTDLYLFMDFADDPAMFWVTMAQVMKDDSSTTVVTKEQKRHMGIKQTDAVTLLLRHTQTCNFPK